MRRFKRIYVCLGPVKKGFKAGCKPIIGLDGCHLNGPYGGQLLAAVGTYSNDEMYPIAWAIVEAENTESWNWFLELLATDVDIQNSGAWTFISDRQKIHEGIGLRTLLWMASRATTDYMFNKHMEELKKLSKKCYAWLMERPRSQWSRSAFLTTCLSDKEGQNAAICPNAMRKVSNGSCMVQWSGASKYLCTMTDGGHEIVVDLDSKSCACRKYDLTGLPCYHACACIKWKNLEMVDYIHKTYYKDMFLSTYTYTVMPINSEQYWGKTPFPTPLPPEIKVQPGRPKKKRNKRNDMSVTVKGNVCKLKRINTKGRCSHCDEEKHNARSCPANKLNKPPCGAQGSSKKKRVPQEANKPKKVPQSMVATPPTDKFTVKGKQTTSVKEIEASKNARKEEKLPIWKL
ncbi:uncharacterized protein LOC141679444 [Apium graveolens]|uniref:uncharacterized protein LOC141679444 n=1 Tax=Apium graveolens TaxID=4045 RepID=UPI003D7A7597